jgi:hypothetical protein
MNLTYPSALVLLFSVAAPVSTQERPFHLPNPRLTPGAALNVTKDRLCSSKYRSLDDEVSISMKRQVFDRYGITSAIPGAYNVDHLIPARLGGANTVKNLWPQPLDGEWTYYKKNRLERRLHRMVCSGAIDLKKAQEEIATDWVGAYQKYLEASRTGSGRE